MITAIEIENFKGIGPRQRIELRPLTLLFGANSAGKSSLLHALHYAREIFERHNLDADRTVAGGEFVDLGGFANLVHGRDLSRRVSLAFELQGEVDLGFYYPGRFQELPRNLRDQHEIPLAKPIDHLRVELSVAWSNLVSRAYVESYTVFANHIRFGTIRHYPDQRTTVLTELNTDHEVLPTEFRTPWPLGLLELLDSPEVREALGSSNSPGPDVPKPDAQGSDVEDLDEGQGKGWRRRVEILLRASPFFSSGEIRVDQLDALPPADRQLALDTESIWEVYGYDLEDLNGEPANCLSDALVEAMGIYHHYATHMFVGAAKVVRDSLRSMRYLGPLRVTPSRLEPAPRHPEPGRWAGGLGAWDRLSDDDGLTERVSHWLSSVDRLATGYSLDLRTYFKGSLSDIRRIAAAEDTAADLYQLPTFRQLEFTDARGLTFRPHDVGIGLSQVVPVVVTCLADNDQLGLIEQPELHLHPRVQAALGDVLIEAGLGETKHTVLVETHSEHLILRLLRRIRETGQGKPHDHPITEAELAIYYARCQEGQSTFQAIEVDRNGDFITPWPDDFFEVDFYERFSDAR